jgi:hypothetical protein
MKIDPENGTRGFVLDALGEVVDGGWCIKGDNEGSFLPEDPELLADVLLRGHSIELRDDESTFPILNLRESGIGHDHVDFDLIPQEG